MNSEESDMVPITGKVSPETKERVKRYVERRGYSGQSEFVRQLILEHFDQEEPTAPDGGSRIHRLVDRMLFIGSTLGMWLLAGLLGGWLLSPPLATYTAGVAFAVAFAVTGIGAVGLAGAVVLVGLERAGRVDPYYLPWIGDPFGRLREVVR